MISVVTPWRISLCERPSSISDSVDHESMLMKPGATASPFASMTVFAFAPANCGTNACYSITSNCDIGLSRLGAGAVVNCPVADDHIKISLGCRWETAALRTW